MSVHERQLVSLQSFPSPRPRPLAVQREHVVMGWKRDLVGPTFYRHVTDMNVSRRWKFISKLVYDCLQSMTATRGYLTCLTLQQFGKNRNLSMNPLTVYISMDDRSDERRWYHVVGAVKQILRERNGWDHVQVHIEHNENMPCAFDPVFPLKDPDNKSESSVKRIQGDYHDAVQIGDDFSPTRYIPGLDGSDANPGFGTIGCFLQVKAQNEPHWRTCVLTNYHVVRAAFDGFCLYTNKQKEVVPASPAPGSDLWNADFNGYDQSTSVGIEVASFESPSRSKHNYTVQIMGSGIDSQRRGIADMENFLRTDKNKSQIRADIREAKGRLARLEAEKAKKIAFFDANKQVLGKLFAASGFRRKSEGRKMDWALIEVDPSRAWSNILPNQTSWASQFSNMSEWPVATYNRPIRKARDAELSLWDLGNTYKRGAATGLTVGKFGWLTEKVQMSYDRHLGHERTVTDEIVFGPGDRLEPWRKLCAHGDSGSALFDKEGGLVALLFRGHKHDGSYDGGYGYATPIELVLKDIKDFTGVTNIRIAQ